MSQIRKQQSVKQHLLKEFSNLVLNLQPRDRLGK
jgi:hypothetical protein